MPSLESMNNKQLLEELIIPFAFRNGCREWIAIDEGQLKLLQALPEFGEYFHQEAGTLKLWMLRDWQRSCERHAILRENRDKEFRQYERNRRRIAALRRYLKYKNKGKIPAQQVDFVIDSALGGNAKYAPILDKYGIKALKQPSKVDDILDDII